jgi:RimJ/RimL family protein N-acetyltransferase
MKHDYQEMFQYIKLCPFEAEHSEKYRMLRNRPEVRKMFKQESEITEEQQRMWYASYLNNKDDFMFSIIDEKNEFIGACSIYNIDEKSSTGEFGRIIVDSKFSGKGYAYKATVAASLIAKYELGLKKLVLEVFEDNIKAVKSYIRGGYHIVDELYDVTERKLLRMEQNLITLN